MALLSDSQHETLHVKRMVPVVCVMREHPRWCPLSILCCRCGPREVTLTSVVLYYILNVNDTTCDVKGCERCVCSFALNH